MKLNKDDYRNKVLGCWFGKNVGGTLGAPFEGFRQFNSVSFYVQKDLDGQPLPNDDLDIQLLWLCALEEKGLNVTAQRLAEYWCMYVTPHWSEYGTAKINMRQGLQPPLSGTFQNSFKHSNGAWIRSEIWACIAPGLPHVAARFAYEDAILDHGNGEGTFAEIFLAAVESAAFVVSDIHQLIEIGLSYIPRDCEVAKAVHTTLECYRRGITWQETRDEILRLHRGGPCLGQLSWVSAEDQAKGFGDGVVGFDAPSNIAITLVGLLYGGEDFGQVQCIAVNCGEDTDCTAATAGSIWGIIRGATALPENSLNAIGRSIKTLCLNLGEFGPFGREIPQTVDNLTDRTVRLARKLLLDRNAEHLFSHEPTDLADIDVDSLKAMDGGRSIWGGMNGPRFEFDFFSVHVDYGEEGPVIRDGQAKPLTVTVDNHYKIQANISLHWHLPEGWTVSPSADGYSMCLPPLLARLTKPLAFTFHFTAARLTRATNRPVLEITIEGRPTVLHVPVTLINGNLLESAPQ
ncbi:MAG: ADP-ribosylglycohydrolase family protein [Verrucomicrobiota bacterium]